MVPVLRIKAGRFDATEVPVHKVRAWWPHVRVGLLAVKEKVKTTWLPEDVFQMLITGRAFLLACTCGSDFAGFAILAPDGDEFSGVKEMLVWEVYCAPPYPDLKTSILPFIEDRAKGLGFDGLVMHSSRKGWQKLGPQLGFIERCVVWVKPLR